MFADARRIENFALTSIEIQIRDFFFASGVTEKWNWVASDFVLFLLCFLVCFLRSDLKFSFCIPSKTKSRLETKWKLFFKMRGFQDFLRRFVVKIDCPLSLNELIHLELKINKSKSIKKVEQVFKTLKPKR